MNTHETILAVYLLLKKDNKILLHHRNNVRYRPLQYGLISGNVEQKESFVEAVIREAYEESGIKLLPANLCFAHCMHRRENDQESVDIFFSAEEWIGEPFNIEQDKCKGLFWYSISELPNETADYIQYAIENIAKDVKYSHYGF